MELPKSHHWEKEVATTPLALVSACQFVDISEQL